MLYYFQTLAPGEARKQTSLSPIIQQKGLSLTFIINTTLTSSIDIRQCGHVLEVTLFSLALA